MRERFKDEKGFGIWHQTPRILSPNHAPSSTSHMGRLSSPACSLSPSVTLSLHLSLKADGGPGRGHRLLIGEQSLVATRSAQCGSTTSIFVVLQKFITFALDGYLNRAAF